MSNTPTLGTPAPIEAVAHRFGIVHQHQLRQVTDSIEQIRRAAALIGDKMQGIIDACDHGDAETSLYLLRSVASHAGYSNTMSANMADLMVELGRLDATVESWVRTWHAACEDRNG